MKNILVTSLLFLIPAFSFASTEDVGQVILSFGKNVAISADGTERALKRKSEIFAEDTLVTGAKGRLQVRFTDGSRLSLQPDTEFQIDQYQFDQKNPDQDKAFYKLIKGGMRTISGKIGKTDREDYKLDAVVATIGIRGTDFSVYRNGDKVRGRVNSGKIHVAAKAGSNREISAGRSFSLVGVQGSVVEFETPPEQQAEDLITDSDGNQQEQDEEQQGDASEDSEDASFDQQEANAEDGSTEDSGSTVASSADSSSGQPAADVGVAAVIAVDPSDSAIPAISPLAEGTQDTVLSSPNPTGNGVAAPVGGTVVLSYIEESAGNLNTSTGSVTVDAVSSLTLDMSTGKDLLTGIQYVNIDPLSGEDVCIPCTFEAPVVVAGVLDAGSSTVGGAEVSWGRWGSDFAVVSNDTVVNVKGSFHFIYADQLTSSAQLLSVAATKSGQYIYGLTNAAQATAMEIETGNLGSLILYNNDASQPDGTYMIINWNSQTIDTFSLKGQALDPVYSNTRFYNLTKKSLLNLPVPLSEVLNGGRLDLQGTCSGSGTNCETIVNMTGRASIEFVGNNAEAAITSYAAKGGPSASGENISITGAALLQDKGAAQ